MHDDNQPNFQEVTLRDLFAIHCLPPLIESALELDHKSWAATAAHAYLIADTMMKEREV